MQKLFTKIPTSILLISVCLILYYVLSVISMASVLFSSSPRSFVWASTLFVQDALVHITKAQDTGVVLSEPWISLTMFFHKKNASLNYELFVYEVRQHRKNEGEIFLENANVFSPHDQKYRDIYVRHLLEEKYYSKLKSDLELRGHGALSPTLAVPLYAAGLNLVRQGDLLTALPFWKTSALLSPSWSHIWIEYASLLLAVGKSDSARGALIRCKKDVFAGTHCAQALYHLDHDQFPPMGYYNKLILGTE